MNKIIASVDTHYDIQFLNFKIDGFWLNEKLAEFYPDKSYKGLVPTLTGMDKEAEEEIVWKRILPSQGETTICPILMCPDDCDFDCTIIVAEIENWGDTILWNRLGMDITSSYDSEQIGSKVEWLSKIGVLEFDAEQYSEMLEIFLKQFQENKSREQ